MEIQDFFLFLQEVKVREVEVLDKEMLNELDDVLFLFFLEVGVIYRE